MASYDDDSLVNRTISTSVKPMSNGLKDELFDSQSQFYGKDLTEVS